MLFLGILPVKLQAIFFQKPPWPGPALTFAPAPHRLHGDLAQVGVAVSVPSRTLPHELLQPRPWTRGCPTHPRALLILTGYTDEPRDVNSTGCPEGHGLTGETDVNHTNPGFSGNNVANIYSAGQALV